MTLSLFMKWARFIHMQVFPTPSVLLRRSVLSSREVLGDAGWWAFVMGNGQGTSVRPCDGAGERD